MFRLERPETERNVSTLQLGGGHLLHLLLMEICIALKEPIDRQQRGEVKESLAPLPTNLSLN